MKLLLILYTTQLENLKEMVKKKWLFKINTDIKERKNGYITRVIQPPRQSQEKFKNLNKPLLSRKLKQISKKSFKEQKVDSS